jgi:hypothetical protein
MTTATGHPAAAAVGIEAGAPGLRQRYYQRFTPLERIMHAR